MNSRQGFQVGVVLVVPIACFAALYWLSRDSYLSICVANLVLFAVLQFLDFEAFILYEDLQKLWQEKRGKKRTFAFDLTVVAGGVIEATPEAILGDENLDNLARLKSLLGETAVFIPEIRNNCMMLLFLNVLLVVALLIMTPAEVLDAYNTTQPAEQLPSSANESSIRLLLSYMAAALQLVWIGRLLFHYRQRNGAYYYKTAATHH